MRSLLILLLTLFLAEVTFAEQITIFNKSIMYDMEVTYRLGFSDGSKINYTETRTTVVPAKLDRTSKNYTIISPSSPEFTYIKIISAVGKDHDKIMSSGVFPYDDSGESEADCAASLQYDVWNQNGATTKMANVALELDDNFESPLILCSPAMHYINNI